MKRWIHASTNLSDDSLSVIRDKEQYLIQFFKQHPKSASLVAEVNSNGFTDEYIISRRLSGRGIELYKHTVDSNDRSRSFGGGVTLARGAWDVAQYMLNLENRGIQFESV